MKYRCNCCNTTFFLMVMFTEKKRNIVFNKFSGFIYVFLIKKLPFLFFSLVKYTTNFSILVFFVLVFSTINTVFLLVNLHINYCAPEAGTTTTSQNNELATSTPMLDSASLTFTGGIIAMGSAAFYAFPTTAGKIAVIGTTSVATVVTTSGKLALTNTNLRQASADVSVLNKEKAVHIAASISTDPGTLTSRFFFF